MKCSATRSLLRWLLVVAVLSLVHVRRFPGWAGTDLRALGQRRQGSDEPGIHLVLLQDFQTRRTILHRKVQTNIKTVSQFTGVCVPMVLESLGSLVVIAHCGEGLFEVSMLLVEVLKASSDGAVFFGSITCSRAIELLKHEVAEWLRG